MKVRWTAWAAGVALVLLAAGVGCQKRPTGNTAAQPQAPSPEDVRVELSDPKVTVLSPTKFDASIKYRFTKGKPAADARYVCTLKLSDGDASLATASLGENEGVKWKAEGELHSGFGAYKPVPAGIAFSYEFQMQQEVGTGKLVAISDPVKGIVKKGG